MGMYALESRMSVNEFQQSAKDYKDQSATTSQFGGFIPVKHGVGLEPRPIFLVLTAQ